MQRLFSTLIFLILALVCIWLAVANRQFVPVSFAPVDTIVDMPLFFVGLFGVLVGILAIGPSAGLKRFSLKRKLSKAEKTIAALETERDALAAENDTLKAQVRPEDAAYANAQIADTPAIGALTGPNKSDTVLPG